MKKFRINSDTQFALDLLRQEKILVTPGTGFNWPEQDHFRVVYLPEMESLRTAAKKLNHFFANYKQK